MYEKVKTVTTKSNFESRQGGGRKSQGAPKAGKPHSRQRAPHQTLMDSGGSRVERLQAIANREERLPGHG